MTRTGPKKSQKARILIVDDHPIVREGLVELLKRQPDMLCCGEAGDAAGTRKAAESLHPDLAIVDLRLGSSDGLELIKSLRAVHPGLRILVLSQLEQNTFAERALRAGAHGFVMKEQASQELLGAIRAVLGGEIYVSRGVALNILRSVAIDAIKPTRFGVQGLTDRELHILHLLGAGLSMNRIAAELHVSPKTVGSHRDNIKRKLGLQTAIALQHFAANWAHEPVSVSNAHLLEPAPSGWRVPSGESAEVKSAA